MAQKITKDMNIMDIVQICPESVAVFQKYLFIIFILYIYV